MKTCPKCKKEYEGHPALSREDNQTYICPACGIREALEVVSDSYISLRQKKHILKYAQNGKELED